MMETKIIDNSKKGILWNLKNGIVWSSKYVISAVVNTLFVSFLSFYATDVLGMPLIMISTVLLVTKLFDGVTDLAAGFIVDNTHTRFGKARPYDWCIPMIALFTILTFSAPKAAPLMQAVYIGVMYVLTQAVFNTLLGASENVYLLRAFPEANERNSIFGISTVFGQILSLLLGVVFPRLVSSAGTDAAAWTRLVILATVPFAVLGMIRFFVIKEIVQDEAVDKAKGSEKEKQSVSLKDGFKAIAGNRYILILTLSIFIIVIASGFLNTAAAYYFTYFVGDLSKMSVISLASFSTLVMLVIFVPLANKFGKANVMKVAMVIAFVGNVIRWIGGSNMVTIAVGMGLMMFGIMPISVYFPLFLFDIIEYGEWKTGKRVEGVLAVFPHFANKVAAGLSVSLGGFVIGAAGYVGGQATQTESAMQAINMSFNTIPTILMGIMTMILILFYDLDKYMPQVREDLKARSEAQAAPAETIKEEKV